VRSLWRADLDGGDIDTVIEDTPMADFYLELAPVDDAEFRILSARLTDEGLLLAWSGSPGERYQIEGSPDLADGEWSVVETGWPSTAVGVTAYLVKPERLGSLRYLRVRR
jgi:hypothetical protein